MTDHHAPAGAIAFARSSWRSRPRGQLPRVGSAGVTVLNLKAGDVGVILSVLYQPFDEIDLNSRTALLPWGTTSRTWSQIAGWSATSPRDSAPMRWCQERRPAPSRGNRAQVALIHAWEGVSLGRHAERVRANVRRLADLGVAYVTLAHLFWRDVATNAPALRSCRTGSTGCCSAAIPGLSDLGRRRSTRWWSSTS